MTHDEDDSLSEALRIYLQHRAVGGCTDAELLEQHPQLRELLEPLLEGGGEGTPRTAIAAHAQIGDYRLIEPIGRGGMGEVWEAEQLSLPRRVALKLFRGARFANVQALERFRREARAGARLQHPNVVAVYGVGEQHDVHYIAQELIPTRRTLANLLQEQRTLPVPRPAYWLETAELFARIADALQQAHAQGVIHRDIKPSNVLLTSDGTPKVADFGIAWIEGELELSRTGDLTGSPFYMSPEQAAARPRNIDARSDVFSLGATLYEALSFVRPFDGDTITQVLNKILLEDPLDPRARRSTCPRELAVICLKMLEKDPARRFTSMQQVADDLRRFVRHEPILAQPSSAWTLAAKWTRRHPVLAMSGALLVASSIVFYFQRGQALVLAREAQYQTGVAIDEGKRADEQRTLAEAGRAEAERQEQLAEAQKLEAQAQREIAERKAEETRRVNAFLMEIFAATDPGRARGSEPTARDLLERGAQRLETELLDQPLVRASLYDTIGRTMLSLGDDARAQELLERGLALRVEAGAGDSLDAAASLIGLANLDLRLGRSTGLARAKEALEMQLRHETGATEQGVACHNTYAQALEATDKVAEARQVYQDGLEYAGRLSVDSRPSRVLMLTRLAHAWNKAEDRERALATANEAVAVHTELSADAHPALVLALSAKGTALAGLKRYEEALGTFDELLDMEGRLSGTSSARYASFLVNRARVSRDMGQFDDERAGLEQALTLFESAASPTDRNALTCRESLLINSLRTARFARTIEVAEALNAILEQAHFTNTSRALFVHYGLAFAHEALGDLDAAITHAERGVEHFASTKDESMRHRVLYLRCALVDWHLRRGDSTTAANVLAESQSSAEVAKADTSRGQWLAFARGNLALARGDKLGAARELEAVASRETGASYAWWVPALARARLASALRESDPERAHGLAARAADELEQRFGFAHAETQSARALTAELASGSR
jgi:tRNA A-37 threonylcarbamoyl transferase component Bud32